MIKVSCLKIRKVKVYIGTRRLARKENLMLDKELTLVGGEFKFQMYFENIRELNIILDIIRDVLKRHVVSHR